MLGAGRRTPAVDGDDLAEDADQLLGHFRGRLEASARVGCGRLLQEPVEGLVALEDRHLLERRQSRGVALLVLEAGEVEAEHGQGPATV